MITPSLQSDAVNAIMVNLVNGHAVIKTGIILWKDFIIMLPGLKLIIIGILNSETLLSATIFMEHRPLVIFGESSFVKESDNALNDCLFCDLLL